MLGALGTGEADQFGLVAANSAHAEAVIMHFDPATAEVREFEHLTRAAHPDRCRRAGTPAALAQRSARSLEAVMSDLAEVETAGRAN
ncbi:hypothetical protein PSA01_65690 [Pseudonocardia saturnea]|uniref:Uncharacterized protein n=1 Tax=Pseudonocardia saturnea TaxID=33909 RepID=A0ABQ0S9E7_9PSEU|nr:hypothetical protein Pdca_69260 [Pseudonocardia autotrophica]GEC29540.1 hypothetical protein PSA01_65690 [Pseudonocardia saturnea]